MSGDPSRAGGSEPKQGSKEDFLTTEEFIANLIARGFAVADMDSFSYGMLINFCKAHDRLERIRHGKPVADSEKQYRELKALEPYIEEQFALGKIKQEKYDSYKKSIAQWEEAE